MIRARLPFPHADHRAFSLVELLLAVFILGIGIIGISALFPAGIAQQRQANDDIMGPIVADNAIALLRSRLKPEWFGTMEEFEQFERRLTPNALDNGLQVVHTYTVPGDWEWKRPGFLFVDVGITAINELGAIDIFSAYFTSLQNGGTLPVIDDANIATETITLTQGELPMFGIPYNSKSPLGCPVVLFSQAERSYPQVAAGAPKTKRPAFFWECMFRRFAGRIQVAIFVYRIVDGGGEPRDYVVSQGSVGASTVGSLTVPPLPSLTDLATAPFASWSFGGLDGLSNTPLDNAVVKTGLPTSTPGAIPPVDSWQAPGQWILDEYNTIHRVMVGRRTSKDATNITLTRPIPAQPPLAELFGNVFSGVGTTNGSIPADPGARFIWFMPTSDANGFSIVPVFVTVQEL